MECFGNDHVQLVSVLMDPRFLRVWCLSGSEELFPWFRSGVSLGMVGRSKWCWGRVWTLWLLPIWLPRFVSASELGYYVPNVVLCVRSKCPVVLSYRRVPINYLWVCEVMCLEMVFSWCSISILTTTETIWCVISEFWSRMLFVVSFHHLTTET
jgi:hypothetical protein